MPNFFRITPFLYVTDMDEAKRFFIDLLGCECWGEHLPSYAYFWREKMAFRVLRVDPDEKAQVLRPGEWSSYVDCEDVAAVVAELAPRLSAWPNMRTHGPVDQAYGQREYMITLPDGHVLVFGQEIRKH
ncbi:VOC family protein [Terriglobus tenax]|uniref:hypothetical protein n=1 Tax=Terriglobus tenax TaxID=1111115 RepID=UPI0021DF751B|nr:hypothetical protein [Terriglobus tenax]